MIIKMIRKSKYQRITDKKSYHRTPNLLFTHKRFSHMGISNIALRKLFFLSENWRCTYRTVVWFNDYMKKPCKGNARKIVGKKNINIRHLEYWRR